MQQKLRLLNAYVGLALLFSGWAAFVLVFIQVKVPVSNMDVANNKSGIEAERMKAIEKARKAGKNEYTYTTSKIPIPLSP